MNEKYSDYKEWYKSKPAITQVKKSISRSGVPLELKTMKLFQDAGYSVSRRHYSSIGRVWQELAWAEEETLREIDIYADKIVQPEFKIGKTEIRFNIIIIAECKYSSDKDLFVFEHIDKSNVNLRNLPIKVNGHSILRTNYSKYFDLPCLGERIIEIDVSNHMSRKGENYTDRIVHGACEQLLPALTYFVNELRYAEMTEYKNMAISSPLHRQWQEYLKEKTERAQIGNTSTVPAHYIDNFLSEYLIPIEHLKHFPLLQFNLIFPLIVIDETRGIIKTKMSKSLNVVGLDDVGMCIYPYFSENAPKYDSIYDFVRSVPILISNTKHAPQVIKMIENGIAKIMEEVRKDLDDSPELIVKEIMFNDKVRHANIM